MRNREGRGKVANAGAPQQDMGKGGEGCSRWGGGGGGVGGQRQRGGGAGGPQSSKTEVEEG